MKPNSYKKHRQSELLRLVEQNPNIATLQNFKVLLEELAEPIYVTEATISRDFKDLGIRRIGGYYQLTESEKVRHTLLALNLLMLHYPLSKVTTLKSRSRSLLLKTPLGYEHVFSVLILEVFRQEITSISTGSGGIEIHCRRDTGVKLIRNTLNDFLIKNHTRTIAKVADKIQKDLTTIHRKRKKN